MLKRSLFVLLFASVMTGMVFAQSKDPVNTFTLDVAPAILGLVAADQLNSRIDDISNTYGFGLGIQYERDMNDYFSMAWRLSYTTFGTNINLEFNSAKIYGLDISAFTVENHIRYYPTSNIFFLGGVVGFTYIRTNIDGNATIEDNLSNSYNEDINVSMDKLYLKFGGKIGWRIRFGKNKNFTLEPSIGYDFAVGLGDTLGSQIKKGVLDKAGVPGGVGDFKLEGMKEADDYLKLVESFIFAGGPRFSLSLGWSF